MNTEQIKGLAISDNGFIFDPTTGYSYNTNELGFLILKMLKDNHSKEAIIQNILDEYDISEDRLSLDFDHYIMQLTALNLIED